MSTFDPKIPREGIRPGEAPGAKSSSPSDVTIRIGTIGGAANRSMPRKGLVQEGGLGRPATAIPMRGVSYLEDMYNNLDGLLEQSKEAQGYPGLFSFCDFLQTGGFEEIQQQLIVANLLVQAHGYGDLKTGASVMDAYAFQLETVCGKEGRLDPKTSSAKLKQVTQDFNKAGIMTTVRPSGERITMALPQRVWNSEAEKWEKELNTILGQIDAGANIITKDSSQKGPFKSATKTEAAARRQNSPGSKIGSLERKGGKKQRVPRSEGNKGTGVAPDTLAYEIQVGTKRNREKLLTRGDEARSNARRKKS